jgi:D-3-phosphoglycerate dehydrogenase / 2-oxoglutarate reductase
MKVLMTEEMHPDGMALLRRFAEVVIAPDLPSVIREADGLIARTQPVPGNLIREAARLRVIGRHGVGYDNIDIAACLERGIPVVYTPDANAVTVAEYVLAAIFALARRLVPLHQAQSAGDFAARRRVPLGLELEGRTVGVVGLGRIGRLVAEKASLLGMQVVGHDPYLSDPPCRTAPLDEVLASADFVTLHTPLTAETQRLMNRERLARMKPGAYLINASRGPVVDEAALVEALQSGHLGGAAIDVYDPEPPDPSHPLLRLPNVLVTPHTAAMTEEAMRRMAVTVAEEVIRVLRGEAPRYLIPECRRG